MKVDRILVLLLGIALIGFMGCAEEEEEEAIVEFDVLTQYMEDNSLDLPTMLADWIVSASVIYDAGLENYFIVDIRKADKYGPGTSGANGVPDYVDGHIPGAHSVALADVVTYESANNTGNLPVVVVCYTGHDAGHATMALRLSGANAQSLKWGMSGWHSDFDLWTSNTGNVAYDYQGAWVDDDVTPDLPGGYDSPVLNTELTDGAAILEYRINNAVLDGLNGIGNTDVLSALSDYQIACYWGDTDWNDYGHIDGSYRVTPGELGLSNLDVLDPAATNVFYCWTGQTASMIAAWLNALGYDARTLKFSANGMIYDDLTIYKWSASAGYSYETGS